METAIKAVVLFIHSLPLGSKFNVYSFGSEYESIFENLTEYSRENMDYAINLIKLFDADLGGTEIFKPLKAIFSEKSTSKMEKHVYLISDGCVFNHEEVIKLIRNNCIHHTLHAFGIGNGVSTDLIIQAA